MFSRLARIVAVLALILGAVRLALVVAIAAGWIGPYQQAVDRYLGSQPTGEVIDRAVVVIAVALALGTLGEIGAALRRS